ncbi:MAG: hypothetical protein WA919_03505 [Coleofasciculaceae cyanobacterium]
MPTQTFVVRAHTRTIHTKPVTFVCGKCHQMTTRECYPGNPPKYCLGCSPRKKRSSATTKPERGMFHATHYLVASSGKRTEVCLEKSPQSGWYWVRTALDWFAGESIIQYHFEKGLHSHGKPLVGYSLEPLSVETTTEEKGDAPPTESLSPSVREYSVREVRKRFKCGDRLLKKMRTSPDFAEWSQSRDPEGRTWEWKNGKFYPVAEVVSVG